MINFKIALLTMITFASYSYAAVISHFEIPINIVQYSSCTNEFINFSGVGYAVNRVTRNGPGGYHADQHINLLNVFGIGETSGTKYRFIGVSNDSFNTNVGDMQTLVTRLKMVSQDSTANLYFKAQEHMTVSSNGIVTSFFDNYGIYCQ